jgi:hypothetical protein
MKKILIYILMTNLLNDIFIIKKIELKKIKLKKYRYNNVQ